MKVSDLLEMDIPARDLISITGMDTTRRTISKARRGLGDARERLGDKIELNTMQLNKLEDAIQNQHRQHEIREADRIYTQSISDFSLALMEEADQLLTFQLSFSVYARKRKQHDELKVKLDAMKEGMVSDLSEATKALALFHNEIQLSRVMVSNLFGIYKEAINTSKRFKVLILKSSKIIGNKSMPKKLQLIDKKAIGSRKESYKIMEAFNVE